MNINVVHLCGRVTRDPELKALPSGAKVCSFSIASNFNYKTGEGEKKEIVEFSNCKAFGKSAELIAQYIKKGSELYVEGRLQTSNWEDKDSGKKLYKTEIIVDKFQFGAKASGATSTAAPAKKVEEDTIEYPEDEIDINDIPF